jgi:hypothetical protein
MISTPSLKELFANQEYGLIIDRCNEVLGTNSRDTNALYNRARCYHMLRDFPQAIRDYRASIATGHSNPEKVQARLRECKFAVGFAEAIATPGQPRPTTRPESWCHFFTRHAATVAKDALIVGVGTAVAYYTVGDKLGMR